MGSPGRLRGFGRCCAALLAWLLGLVALPAIGPELPTPDGAVIVILPAGLEELPGQRLAELAAHPPQAPPAASSFSQPEPTAVAVVVFVWSETYRGGCVFGAIYVGTSDPVNKWDPTGLWEIDYQTGTAVVEDDDTLWSLWQELRDNNATSQGWDEFQGSASFFNDWRRGGRTLDQLQVGETIRFGYDQNSLFLAFDGTANHFREADDNGGTNVAAMFFLSRARIPQYIAGVGNSIEFNWRDAFYGKVEGFGLNAKIEEGLAQVRAAYGRGVRRVDAVGFSRGGAAAVEFSLRLNRMINDGHFPGLEVGFLGIFDAVPGLHKDIWDMQGRPREQGLMRFLPPTPAEPVTESPLAAYRAFQVGLPQAGPGAPDLAVHLVSLDETRTDFQVLNIQGAFQAGVAGVHSDIGGGYGRKGLSNAYLHWMINAARRTGADIFTVQEGVQAARRSGNVFDVLRLGRFLPTNTAMAPHREILAYDGRVVDVPWEHAPRWFPWLDYTQPGWRAPMVWRGGEHVFRSNRFTRE